MKFSLKELKRISRWFDLASQCEDLEDLDLKIYDKINSSLEDIDEEKEDSSFSFVSEEENDIYEDEDAGDFKESNGYEIKDNDY